MPHIDAQESASAHARALAIYAPKPDYSFDARSHWVEGRGLFLLSVRPDGTVDSVQVDKSTGHRELDESAIAALEKWRFKPGIVSHVKIPMEFTMAGLRPAGIDAALQAEKGGSPPPSGYVSWREYWQKCILLWTGYHHADYANYFHKRRKTLGLEDISAQ